MRVRRASLPKRLGAAAPRRCTFLGRRGIRNRRFRLRASLGSEMETYDVARFLGSLFFALLVGMPALWWARKNSHPWASCLASCLLSGLVASSIFALRGVEEGLGIVSICWFLVWLFWQTRKPRIESGWTRLKVTIAAVPAFATAVSVWVDPRAMAVFSGLTLLVVVVLAAVSWIAAGFASGAAQ